jgi:hypothetical protein
MGWSSSTLTKKTKNPAKKDWVKTLSGCVQAGATQDLNIA